ncbi:hypothetical protein HELRODRAFT_103921 [Helobdella robusta]|uniref:Small integral membrane protein 12 n=1 Tax=Helobdella robusta TaxID=6412 RepID=T1EDI5_HELRO|nr:hypothetical protein HELRODRAFT_103921 [Helobdella robusta]ESN92218.1 hypothetical protein HELRODRAFT_103921 [Helobdella robusta]
MVLPLIMAAARAYAPYVIWPAAFVVGAIGYKLEWWVRSGEESPWKKESISDERVKRILAENENKDLTVVDKLKDRKFIPKTVFDQ